MSVSRTIPWNGSKRWMESALRDVFVQWDGKGRFYDPFCGSGFVSALMRDCSIDSPQILGDVNPWLVGFFKRQTESNKEDAIPDPGAQDIEYWRNLRDPSALSVNEQAARFLICLLSSWGARYQDNADGTFGLPMQKEQGRFNQAMGTLPEMWRTFWLTPSDKVACQTWLKTVADAQAGDLVFLDPPYTETMGYGVAWDIGDQLAVWDWAAEAISRGVLIVATNHEALGKYYARVGLTVDYFVSPARGRTSKLRREMLAYSPSLSPSNPIQTMFGVQ